MSLEFLVEAGFKMAVTNFLQAPCPAGVISYWLLLADLIAN